MTIPLHVTYELTAENVKDIIIDYFKRERAVVVYPKDITINVENCVEDRGSMTWPQFRNITIRVPPTKL